MNIAQAADGLEQLCCGYCLRRICRALLRCVVCALQSSDLLPTFFARRICRSSNPALNFPPAQIHRAKLRSRPDSLFSVGLQNRSQVSIPLARTQTPVLSYSLRRMFTNTASLASHLFCYNADFALSLKAASQKPVPLFLDPTLTLQPTTHLPTT